MILAFSNIVSQHILIYCIIILQGKKHKCDCDIVFFYGSSNVKNAGKILQARHPRITFGHGSEHVVSLFFETFF